MSEPQEIPARNKEKSPKMSPIASPTSRFLIPSPVPTKRNRTYSQSERARAGPSFQGTVKSFCREKGHGFIVPKEGGEPLFVHISDIDGDFVPKPSDEVRYKLCAIPPKMEKHCAVHVSIVHPADGVPHETWEAGLHHSPKH